MPIWKIKEKTTDEKGLTTTKTITTENQALAERLLKAQNSTQREKSDLKAQTVKETKAQLKAPKLEAPKATLELSKNRTSRLTPPSSKGLIALNKEVSDKPKKKQLARKPISGKAQIKHTTRNLNESMIQSSNYNSMNGTRGTQLKNSYETYRHKIEFSGLTNKQKSKLLDKLYKLYEPILRYDSQWYSPMVSGPARYPQAKMDAINEKMMKAISDFQDWWKSIEPQLNNAKLTPKEKKESQEEARKKEIERIKKGFNLWYNRLVDELPAYKEKGRNPKYSANAGMAQSYVNDALKVDTALYKELFEKLNEICNFSKNSNIYKGYKLVQEGQLTSESIQKQKAEDNKVIYSCSDYVVSNLKIDAGKRIAIKFTFYPKPQLVYALKKRGFTWYTFKDCFICKPERFDLEWAKSISEKYEKYI